MNLDVNALTLGEIAMIEDLSGQSIASMGEDDTPKGKFLAALALVAKRRNGFPGFKWGDAIALTMEEASAAIGLDTEDTSDAGEDSDTDESSADDGDEPAPKARTRKAPKKP